MTAQRQGVDQEVIRCRSLVNSGTTDVGTPLSIGSLFSGIGGLELGLERAGLGPVIWQVEKDAYCRAVLAKHWPDATRFEDVKDVGRTNLAAVDVICGGFPCQDISVAGKQAGILGDRSGLWSEFARIIRELRPRYVVVENVAALLVRGLDVVLGELAASGYDAEWDCLPASSVGAPHQRDRVFIVAYASSSVGAKESRLSHQHTLVWTGVGSSGRDEPRHSAAGVSELGRGEDEADVADATGQRCEGELAEPSSDSEGIPGDSCRDGQVRVVAYEDADRERNGLEGFSESGSEARSANRSGDGSHRSQWAVEPNVGRVAHGVPARVDRLRALGNAVVPQVAEVVGRVILELEAQRGAA